MNAGRLRYKIKLLTRSYATDQTYGSPTITTTETERWADMRFELLNKTVEGGQYIDRRKCFFYMRKDSVTETLTERDQIKYGSDVFEISKIAHRGLGNEQWVEVETIGKE
jgi:hypothetical protein